MNILYKLSEVLLQVQTETPVKETSILATAAILTVLVLVLALVIYRVYKRKKNCGSSACAGCPAAGHCHSKSFVED